MDGSSNRTVDSRYALLEKLGEGGMGEVYRALDGLTRQTVALKRVRIGTDATQAGSSVDLLNSEGLRLALAQEFHILASLRHPNIISVLDYGFDEERQPYYTMDFLAEAQNLLEAGRGQNLPTRLNLLVQTLEATAYLHRRGIIHRDLKPANVLMAAGEVKVLDFGLSQAHDQVTVSENEVAGTLAYVAPEVLRGEHPGTASDLYAIGIIAYELLVGHHPFDTGNIGELINSTLFGEPDLSPLHRLLAGEDPFEIVIDESGDTTVVDLEDSLKTAVLRADEVEEQRATRKLDTIETKLAAVLSSPLPDLISLPGIVQKLLAKSPEFRYQNAEQVIEHLHIATGHVIPAENPAIRESYLSAARFVGREAESAQLAQALVDAREGRGSAWLIGGESGVGKSRLLDELRTRGLVEGFLVLRGQGIAEGGLPYQLWRDPVRRLALSTELNDLDAGILKDIAQDMDELQARSIPAAAPVEGAAYQQRLLGSIASLFQRQQKPVLLLLEDLQWSRESIDMLKLLSEIVTKLPLLIVGSYRDDERPELPSTLPAMQVMKLERLDPDGIAALSISMLGEAGRHPQLLEFLRRETEGNIYFIVEVVRALAEEAGRLGQVGRVTLPQHVIAGGVQAILERRLSRIPPEGVGLLRLAAVAGRELDLSILERMKGDLNLEEWLIICANCAVLEVREERWRFSHNKLRLATLDLIPVEERAGLHRRVAEAIEGEYPDAPEQAAIIAQHYRSAGDAVKERYYQQRAGEHALYLSSFTEAVDAFRRTLELLDMDAVEAGNQQIRAELLLKLGEALQYTGDYAQANAHISESFVLYEVLGDAAGAARALNLRGDIYWRSGDHAAAITACSESLKRYRAISNRVGEARALNRLGMIALEQGDYERAKEQVKAAVAAAESVDERIVRATGIHNLGLVALRQGDFASAVQYLEQSLTMNRASGERWKVASGLVNLGTVAGIQGDLAAATENFEQALEISRAIGDRRGIALALDNLGFVAQLQGKYDQATMYLEESFSLAQAIGNRQNSANTLLNLGHVATAQNNAEKAVDLFYQALRIAHEINVVPIILESISGLARYENRPSRSAAWLSFVLNHPATSPETREMAQKIQDEIKGLLSADEFETSAALGQSLELTALVDDLLRTRTTQ